MSRTALESTLAAALAALPPGGIVVGFSGGLDSSCLLHALAAAAGARTRGLRALHVDHGLHADSASWAAHCRAVADALDVPISVLRVDIDHARGEGIEAAARAARMDALAQALRDGEIVALAQHRDDQAETMLLKLLRGAGPEGLAGMRALRAFAPGWLWRPLLGLPRIALRDYARAANIAWIEDPSNAQTHLQRNFLRAEIVPRLRARWPDVDMPLAHSANWLRAAADFIDDEAQKALARLQGLDPRTLNWQGWLVLPDALRDPVLRRWLRGLGLDEPAQAHVCELERQLRARADRLPCISFAHTELRRYRDLLYALGPTAELPPDWEAPWDGAMPLRLPGGGSLRAEPARAFDAPLRVRGRRGGERLKPAGNAHSRELRLLLQEAGVPPWLRSTLPLVYHGDELLAVGDLILTETGVAFCRDAGLRFVWTPADASVQAHDRL